MALIDLIFKMAKKLQMLKNMARNYYQRLLDTLQKTTLESPKKSKIDLNLRFKGYSVEKFQTVDIDGFQLPNKSQISTLLYIHGYAAMDVGSLFGKCHLMQRAETSKW